ncbi:hypothetical protein ABZ734_33215 [Streptomyces sp. NPDC006660]|uniref:hypothetical protein n=1 Tax=Streptomyces sp. NPDC006660 TaxID=3156901 RepID=UPI0033D9651B
MSKEPLTETPDTGPESPDADATAPEAKPAPEGEHRTDGAEQDGPVSESDALRNLTESTSDADAERSDALRAGAIADLIAQRLNDDASGTRIGTLALFNETVSFGGGFNTTGGGRRAGARGLPTLALDPSEVAGHTDLFVQPSGYGDALGVLCEERLLVLTGAPGSGREATAVNLLGEALALSGGGACHRLLDPAVLLESDWTPQAENTGYLASLEDGPAGVTGFAEALRRLPSVVAALRAGGGLLVLTGGHDLTLLLRGPGGAAIATHALRPVDPLAVLERRVLGHAEDPESRTALRALVETTGAARALREQPAARHAARLASVIRAGGDVAAEAAALRDPSDQVRDWFDRYREPEALAFALAAATLEGSGYLTVSEAAVKLCKALTPPEPAAVDLRFRDRVGYEQQWIQLVPDGSGPPRVRFRSALLGQVILRYAWTSLDGWREAVLAWLRQLLSHSDLEVRARAAVAAGVLASADHHYAVHRFLTSWAGAASWPLRQAAATALGVAGSRPETSEAVWELLDGWARGGSSAQQRRLAGTAANAVGGILGREAPERAVAVLRAALDRGDDWGTLPSVAWGGVHLIHQGQAGALLDACLEWSEPQDLSPMVVKSLSAFVFAASRPYERTADGPAGAVPGVPLLLSGLPRHGDRLAELWARALARRPLQETALDALRAWIDTYCDKCPGSLDPLGTLLLDVASRPGSHRRRLLWWLEKWEGDRERPSKNAAVLRRRLERGA